MDSEGFGGIRRDLEGFEPRAVEKGMDVAGIETDFHPSDVHPFLDIGPLTIEQRPLKRGRDAFPEIAF